MTTFHYCHMCVFDMVADNEIYSFLDGFSGYNQVQMHLDD